MTNLEFILLFSIFPVGALIAGAFVFSWTKSPTRELGRHIG